MDSGRRAALLAIAILAAGAPAVAQDATQQTSLFTGQPVPGGGDPAPVALADFRGVLAKQAREDGGTLSPRHAQMMRTRLLRILAEKPQAQGPVGAGYQAVIGTGLR